MKKMMAFLNRILAQESRCTNGLRPQQVTAKVDKTCVISHRRKNGHNLFKMCVYAAVTRLGIWGSIASQVGVPHTSMAGSKLKELYLRMLSQFEDNEKLF